MTTNAKVLFEIKTDFIRTGFTQLITLGGTYRKIDDSYFWVFPLENIEKVSAILGKAIEFSEEDVATLEARCPMRRERIGLEPWKGVSGITIEETPTLFIVTEHRKEEGGDVKEIRHNIPSENVDALRRALSGINSNLYKDGRIPTSRVAEKVCQVLNIDRFNRVETGSFDFAKMFGNRQDYFHILYYPLKILQKKGEIIYLKSGKIIKK
jgi:hypothetical protein